MLVGTFIVQVKFAMGGGSINFRYLLPAVLPLSLFIAYGLLRFSQLRGQLIALVAILMGGTTLWQVGHPAQIIHLAANNGVPSVVVRLLLMLFVLGAIFLSVSLWHLSKGDHSNR